MFQRERETKQVIDMSQTQNAVKLARPNVTYFSDVVKNESQLFLHQHDGQTNLNFMVLGLMVAQSLAQSR